MRATAGNDCSLANTQKQSRQQVQVNSLEVIYDGLAFDFRGLAPGAALNRPELRHTFECQPGELTPCEAAGLFPGPHLADGANMLPVVRAMLALGAGLAERLDDVRAVCWTPASSAVAPRIFIGAVRRWLVGGQFPAPGLFGLWRDASGAVRSEGLAFFIDREMVIDGDLCGQPGSAAPLAASIVHHLVGYGAPVDTIDLTLDDGRMVRLDNSDSGGVLRVRSATQPLPKQEVRQAG